MEKHHHSRRNEIQQFTRLKDHALQRAVWWLEARGLIEHEGYRPMKITKKGQEWLDTRP
jgi:Mn-dependent DtxR family transcriptional regulator